jgi:CheY-like chemotaxis protein
VADESATSRELLRILLEHEGCEVTEAVDGLQAVAIARRTLPDLILLDLDLPQLDGYAAVREMRRDVRLHSRCIVALSGNSPDDERDRLHEAGFTSYITKPVVRRILSGELGQLLPA